MLTLSPMAMFLIAQAVASASAKPDSTPVLQIGVFSYTADERMQGAAYETSLSRESFQYVAGCAVGAGNRPVPDAATDAWRISGSVQGMSADEAVIQLDWQRIRANGVAASSPGASVQLTLHPGDRVPLDSVNRDATAGCAATLVGFEARFGPRPFTVAGGTVRGTAGGARVGAGLGQGQGVGVGGSGRAVRVETGSASSSEGDAVATARSVHAPKPTLQGNDQFREYNADLWLVRTDKAHPEKPDFNLQGLILQKVHGTAEFAFSPFTVDTSAGPLNVQITGSLRVTTENGPSLIFTTARTIRYTSVGPGREATSSATGNSTTTNPLSGPDEVLSFELPPIRVPNSTTTVPDQYSVRVRIR